MLSIADVPSSSRYLMLAARLSASRWNDECASVRLWFKTRPSAVRESSAQQMLQMINTPLAPDAIPLVVIHCYADIPAGTDYHVAFDPADPEMNEPAHAETVFGVVMGRYVDGSLAHGWHQTAVLRFPNGLPCVFSQLPVDTMTSKYVGLCARADFPEIVRALRTAD